MATMPLAFHMHRIFANLLYYRTPRLNAVLVCILVYGTMPSPVYSGTTTGLLACVTAWDLGELGHKKRCVLAF